MTINAATHANTPGRGTNSEELQSADRTSQPTRAEATHPGTEPSLPAFDASERKERLSLLAQLIAQLPDVPKKILAMYYYENMRLSEIAACFGLSESRVGEIRALTVRSLRDDFLRSECRGVMP